jgi:transcriptional regulator with XRE-family HTH domain
MVDDAPLDKRRKLGRELKILRQRAGLTGPELAKLIGTTQTRVSRIENAVVKPKIADVQAWAEVASLADDERDVLLRLAEEALTEVSEWQAVLKGSLAGRQRELMATDKVAREIRHFQIRGRRGWRGFVEQGLQVPQVAAVRAEYLHGPVAAALLMALG